MLISSTVCGATWRQIPSRKLHGRGVGTPQGQHRSDGRMKPTSATDVSHGCTPLADQCYKREPLSIRRHLPATRSGAADCYRIRGMPTDFSTRPRMALATVLASAKDPARTWNQPRVSRRWTRIPGSRRCGSNSIS